MLNILFNKWVKIVNKPRTTRSISCDRSSTKYQHNQNGYVGGGVKTTFNKLCLPHNSTTKNTPQNDNYYLLNKSFTLFPQNLLIDPLNEN